MQNPHKAQALGYALKHMMIVWFHKGKQSLHSIVVAIAHFFHLKIKRNSRAAAMMITKEVTAYTGWNCE
jgi:hypothetical protein